MWSDFMACFLDTYRSSNCATCCAFSSIQTSQKGSDLGHSWKISVLHMKENSLSEVGSVSEDLPRPSAFGQDPKSSPRENCVRRSSAVRVQVVFWCSVRLSPFGVRLTWDGWNSKPFGFSQHVILSQCHTVPNLQPFGRMHGRCTSPRTRTDCSLRAQPTRVVDPENACDTTS